MIRQFVRHIRFQAMLRHGLLGARTVTVAQLGPAYEIGRLAQRGQIDAIRERMPMLPNNPVAELVALIGILSSAHTCYWMGLSALEQRLTGVAHEFFEPPEYVFGSGLALLEMGYVRGWLRATEHRAVGRILFEEHAAKIDQAMLDYLWSHIDVVVIDENLIDTWVH